VALQTNLRRYPATLNFNTFTWNEPRKSEVTATQTKCNSPEFTELNCPANEQNSLLWIGWNSGNVVQYWHASFCCAYVVAINRNLQGSFEKKYSICYATLEKM
jgi:hypothetical protein